MARRFIEKPPLEEAERMVQSGDYLWNTGIFAWPNGLFLDELRRHAPGIAAGALLAAAAAPPVAKMITAMPTWRCRRWPWTTR